MNFTVIECEQRSDAWHAARIGRLTGSRAGPMMAKIKSGAWAASRRNLRVGMGLERITGKSYERAFTSRVVAQGVEGEPIALGMYEARSGYILDRPGFLSCGPIMVGVSLDAAVNDFEGIVEAKSPESATHYEYLKTRQIPEDYYWQCVHGLWVSNAQWCDFISVDLNFPVDLQYLCVRMERDESVIAAYANEAERFLAEVVVEVNEIQKLRKAA
jgi:YqaJ-like viral recombinase domain